MVDETTVGLDTPASQHSEDNSSAPESENNLDGYVPISRMNESNAITRKKSYEKGYQRGRDEISSGLDRQTQSANASDAGFNASQVQGMIKEEAQKIVASGQAEAEKRNLAEWGRAVESDFLTKSEKYKADNPEFDGKEIVEKASQMAPFAFAHSASMENSPEVWQHLLKENPAQLHALEQMVLSNNPIKQQAAMGEIKKVSDRLKQNRAGKDSDIAPTPVDRIEKTTHGVGQGGEASFDYFRNLHGRRRK